ncbi:MAG: dGTP triphosphohydrolase [Leadbetterella sp.]
MYWENLFTNHRLGSRNLNLKNDSRGAYIRDYDKVIFSSQFRKLQNKTQVFPFPGSIFVHNRLTHSLEVACVGRSMARMIGEKLAEIHQSDWGKETSNFYKFELSDVIQTACLSHDIGNPPFGHFGEEAIRSFFSDFFKDHTWDLSQSQIRDLQKFEGNANAFRILTSLFLNNGLKLTYPTIASIIKYPVSSIAGFQKTLIKKKSGFFQNEKDHFTSVMETLGVPKISEDSFARHPYVYIVEAADDICYRIIDLEDALRLHIVPYNELEALLLPFFAKEANYDFILDQLSQILDAGQKISFLRAMLINILVEGCTEVYLAHEKELLEGTLDKSLIDLLPIEWVDLLKKIDNYSVKYIYNSQRVIEKELTGHKVIYGLLEQFVNSRIYPKNATSKKIKCLLPFTFSEELYTDLLQILDYITDMTDEQALDMYNRIC